MSKIPISICIIAKNEEKHIEECLKRLIPYGFEIIVTDTGSTDKTREIALQYADKVLDFAWIQDFSAARNFCAAAASNNWILALDCDEYVADIDMPALQKSLKAFPKDIGKLRLQHLTISQKGEKGYASDDVPRLYNKKYFEFQAPVHEQIVSIHTAKNAAPVQFFLVPMKAVHYGYALPPEEMRKKQERNLSLLYHELSQKGQSAYLCFQIGQSELVLENYRKAIEYYEKTLSFDMPRKLTYIQSAIEGLAKCYVCVGRCADALALMERYASECDSATYAYFHANVLMDNNEPLRALVKYVKVTTLPDAANYEKINSYRHIIELYHKYGEYELARFFEQKYQECLEEREQI